jgi:photosystem II stability/assembly factor-like uncharacterized protein
MLTDKELRSQLEAALEAVTPPAPWLSASIEKAWQETRRSGRRRRIALGFRISLRVAAVAVLLALVLASTALFLATHLATMRTAPAGGGQTHATPRSDWGMVSSTIGWQETAWFDVNGWHHILRTSDGGSHWKDVTPPASVTSGISPANLASPRYILDANHLWIVVAPTASVPPSQGSLVPIGLVTFRTADGGKSWQRGALLSTPLQEGLESFTLYFVDATHGWLLKGTVADGVLFATTDGGLHWRLVSTRFDGADPHACAASAMAFASPAFGWLSVECPEGASLVARLLVTHDGGSTWSIESLPLAANETVSAPPVVFDEQNALLLVDDGRGGGRVLMTSDSGVSWRARALPGEAQLSVNFVDPKHGWAVAGPSSWFLKTAAGLPSEPDVPLPLYRTDDGGLSWSAVRTSATIDSSQGRVSNLYFVDQKHGFMERVSATTGRTLLFKTTDGGHTWASIGPVPPQ